MTVVPWEHPIVNRMGQAILTELARPGGARDVAGLAAATGLPQDLTATIVNLLERDGLVSVSAGEAS